MKLNEISRFFSTRTYSKFTFRFLSREHLPTSVRNAELGNVIVTFSLIYMCSGSNCSTLIIGQLQ